MLVSGPWTDWAAREHVCNLKIYPHVQGSNKEWDPGCVKHAPAARGGQDAGITQPRHHSFADPHQVDIGQGIATQMYTSLFQDYTEGNIKVCLVC